MIPRTLHLNTPLVPFFCSFQPSACMIEIQMCKDLVVYWLKTLLPSLAENDCIESLATGGGVRNFVKEMIKHTLTGKTKPISAKEVQEHLEKRKYSQQKAEEYVRQLFRFLKKSVEDTLEFTVSKANLCPMNLIFLRTCSR